MKDLYRLNIIVIRGRVIALRLILIIRVEDNYWSWNIFFGIVVILKACWVRSVKLILFFDCVFRFKFYAGLIFFVVLPFGCIFGLKFYICFWFCLYFCLGIYWLSFNLLIQIVMIFLEAIVVIVNFGILDRFGDVINFVFLLFQLQFVSTRPGAFVSLQL